jgi:hypothetical protein
MFFSFFVGLLLCSLTSTRATLCTPPVPTLEQRDTPFTSPPPNTAFIATSCQSAQVRFGVLRVRVRGGAIVEVLCHHAKEYIVLPAQSADSNFATIESRTTRFCAVRFDPPSLLVDLADFSFAASEGAEVTWSGQTLPFSHVPFAVAGDCRTGGCAVRRQRRSARHAVCCR